MKKKWLLVCLLALALAASGGLLLKGLYGQRRADQAYEEAARIAEVEAVPAGEDCRTETDAERAARTGPNPEEGEAGEEQAPLAEGARFLLEVDLEALRETSEDVIGWFFIPDSVMSYPLMRSRDNNEYLTLSWDGAYSESGAIFLECQNDPGLSDFHTLIYGHNLQNGEMFSHLLYYRDQDYLDSHPCVYIATDDAVFRYEVFSAYVADVVSDTYRLYFEDDGRKRSAIHYYLEQSAVDSGLVPTAEDRILTLSTCTGLGIDSIRWVVHGVLTGEFPR